MRYLKYLATTKAVRQVMFRSLTTGAFITALLFASLSATYQAQASPGSTDCDNNAVIYCGISSIGDLTSKYNNGDSHNSVNSIQNIYSWFGISNADIQSISTYVKNGTVTSGGRVMIGEDVVATDAVTAGRQDIAGSTKHVSEGTTFYSRPPSVSFVSSPLKAYVVMKNGVFQYAILTSCGNPVKAQAKTPPPAPTITPPAPSPTPAPAAVAPAQPTMPAAAPAPAATCSGNTTNTNSGVGSQGGNCSINTTTVVQQTQTTPSAPPPPATEDIPPPAAQCTSLLLTASQNGSLMNVTASLSYSAQGGAQLQNITYDFGDGSVTPPTTQTTQTHVYQQSGTYVVTATLAFTGSQAVTPATCQSTITIVPAPAPSAPPTPTASVTTASASTSTTPEQTKTETAAPAKQLVNTGPGSMASVFGLTTATSAFIYHLYLRRRSIQM